MKTSLECKPGNGAIRKKITKLQVTVIAAHRKLDFSRIVALTRVGYAVRTAF